jgi:hypothetical protein
VLKSLVLANETASSDLRDIYEEEREFGLMDEKSENTWQPGLIAMSGIAHGLPVPKKNPAASPSQQKQAKEIEAAKASSFISTVAITANPLAFATNHSLFPPDVGSQPDPKRSSLRKGSSPTRVLEENSKYRFENGDREEKALEKTVVTSATAVVTKPAISTVSSAIRSRYSQIWSQLDQLELALKKLDVTKWEHDRIEENLLMGPPLSREDVDRKSDLFARRLARDMQKLGVEEQRAQNAVDSLMEEWGNHAHRLGTRMEIRHRVRRESVSLDTLRKYGVSFWECHDDPNCLLIQRWVPEYFEEVLWAHTARMFELDMKAEDFVSSEPQMIMQQPNTPSTKKKATVSELAKHFQRLREEMDAEQGDDDIYAGGETLVDIPKLASECLKKLFADRGGVVPQRAASTSETVVKAKAVAPPRHPKPTAIGIWEAARATSAAPAYSRTKEVVASDVLAEREAEIRNIEANITELNELFKDLGSTVQEQGAAMDTTEAQEELKNAVLAARASRGMRLSNLFRQRPKSATEPVRVQPVPGGSPGQGNAILQNQSPSMLGVAPSMNPRISSPQTSPSPIPQPAASGGRPPSSLQGQGNGPIFGSLGGDSNDVCLITFKNLAI